MTIDSISCMSTDCVPFIQDVHAYATEPGQQSIRICNWALHIRNSLICVDRHLGDPMIAHDAITTDNLVDDGVDDVCKAIYEVLGDILEGEDDCRLG